MDMCPEHISQKNKKTLIRVQQFKILESQCLHFVYMLFCCPLFTITADFKHDNLKLFV